MKILSVLVKISWKTELGFSHNMCYFTWKLEFISNIFWLIVSGDSLVPDPLKFDLFDNFCNSKGSDTVLTKIRETNLQKSAKIFLNL